MSHAQCRFQGVFSISSCKTAPATEEGMGDDEPWRVRPAGQGRKFLPSRADATPADSHGIRTIPRFETYGAANRRLYHVIFVCSAVRLPDSVLVKYCKCV